MDFSLTGEQQEIKNQVERICAKFDLDYWRDHDNTGEFPEDFVKAITDAGFLGIAMPEEVGGAGLGIVEATILMHTVSRSGAGLSGASAIHMNIFSPKPIAIHGTPEQKQAMLPPLISGKDRTCFGVTEPDAGLNTTAIKTFARRVNDGYVINGKKLWTSTAQTANKVLLLARTTPREDCKRPTDGLSLFYTDMDRKYVTARVIPKMGRKAVDSNEVFIDDLPVPPDHLIGEEGRGFYYLLDGLNPERVLIASEAVGLGQIALERAAQYANERVVFDRPIGMNQGIQHPLADSWAKLASAELLVYKAASLFDAGQPCGVEANAAKYWASEACYEACERALLTHGGMGYAKEFHVERFLREAMITRIAPISPHLILNFIAERALGLPKSY